MSLHLTEAQKLDSQNVVAFTILCTTLKL